MVIVIFSLRFSAKSARNRFARLYLMKSRILVAALLPQNLMVYLHLTARLMRHAGACFVGLLSRPPLFHLKGFRCPLPAIRVTFYRQSPADGIVKKPSASDSPFFLKKMFFYVEKFKMNAYFNNRCYQIKQNLLPAGKQKFNGCEPYFSLACFSESFSIK